MEERNNTNIITDREKVVSLFTFIRELSKLRQKSILNMRKHLWCFELSDLPDDPVNIRAFYRDRVENEDPDALHYFVRR